MINVCFYQSPNAISNSYLVSSFPRKKPNYRLLNFGWLSGFKGVKTIVNLITHSDDQKVHSRGRFIEVTGS